MKPKYLLLYFLLFLIFFSVVIIPFSRAILNENDINFEWITTKIYDNQNLVDYDVSDTVNYVQYNNSDYFEHANAFDSFNYTSDIYQYELYNFFESENYVDLYWNGSYFYLLNFYGNLYRFDNEFRLIEYYNDLGPGAYYAMSWNGTHFFTVKYYGTGVILEVFDYDFNYITEHELTDIDTPSPIVLELALGMCYDDTYFYISSAYDEKIYVYDVDFVFQTSYDVSSDIDVPVGMVYDGVYYYVVSNNDNTIYQYNSVFVLQDSHVISTITNMNALAYDSTFFYILTNTAVYKFNINFELLYSDYIEYYPEAEGLFDSVDNLNASLTLQTNALGNYQATHSFEHGIDDYYTYSYGDYAEYVNNFDEHNDVLFLNATQNSRFSTYFGAKYGEQQIEFWILPTTVANIYIDVRATTSGSTTVLQVVFISGQFYIYDGGYVVVGSYQVNEWSHIRFVIDIDNEKYDVVLNGDLVADDRDFFTSGISYISRMYITSYTNPMYLDAVGYSWDPDYEVNDNLQFSESENGFWNEIVLENFDLQEILTIKCKNGSYYVNDTDINFNVFYYNSSMLYDVDYSVLEYNLIFDVDQILESGTIYFYNKNYTLLYYYDFSSANTGNVKYIKYVQYYQNTTHYVNISDFIVYSNDTKITGDNAFISYELDLIDTTVWNFEINEILKINAYGKYRFYVSNETYSASSTKYLISDYIEFKGSEQEIDLSEYNYSIVNPWLIVESLNGIYSLYSIVINCSTVSWLLYDDRGYSYSGSLEYSNIDLNQSYFYVKSEKLYFTINYDDSDLEYMKLSFDIENNDNQNYQLIYSSYISDTNTSLINRFQFFCTDGTYISYDINPYFSSNIEILNQNKIISDVEILISDNDLQDNLNVSGYIGGFTFNYSEQINISLFVEQMLIMLIPIIVILAMSFALSYVFRQKNDKLNKSVFFPIFSFTSILVFILGFFDTWILFILAIDIIAYFINKRGNS